MLRALLVDDHARFRAALRSRLEGSGRVRVVGEAEDGRGTLDAIGDLLDDGQPLPDVVVMDIRLRDDDGLAVTRGLLARWPGLHVVALSTHQDPTLVQAWAALGGGAFVTKGGPLAVLLEALVPAGPPPADATAPRQAGTDGS